MNNADHNENFFDNIEDPRDSFFDFSTERFYLEHLLNKLSELDSLCPDRNYAEIFYRKYIEKIDNKEICNICKINEDELYKRFVAIVRFINK